MTRIHFQILDLHATIPKHHHYVDLGYTPNLRQTTQKIFEKSPLHFSPQNLEQHLAQFKVSLSQTADGRHIGIVYPTTKREKRYSFIFYNKYDSIAKDTFLRAHEEAHALYFLFGRDNVNYYIYNLPFALHTKPEEELCDYIALETLKKKGITPEPQFLLPYNIRCGIK